LIEDGRQHLLLTKAIALDIPVRILHGQQDDAVPWELSLELASALTSQNVTLQFLKDGDHRLSTPAQIDTLCQLIDDVLTAIARP
jgi:alpha-beta hydrolase superfamily lysophospholipase